MKKKAKIPTIDQYFEDLENENETKETKHVKEDRKVGGTKPRTSEKNKAVQEKNKSKKKTLGGLSSRLQWFRISLVFNFALISWNLCTTKFVSFW